MIKAARCLDAVLAAVGLAAAVGRQLLLSNIVPEHVNNQPVYQIYGERDGCVEGRLASKRMGGKVCSAKK